MNILHVISSLDPATGGPPRIALRLAAGVTALGHRATLLAYDTPGARSQIDRECAEIPGADAIRRIILPPPGRFERLFGRIARRELNRIVPDFDFVHVHTLWNAMSRQAFAVADRLGVPYTLLGNGMLDPWSMRQKKLKKQIAMATGMRGLLDRATFLQAGNLDEKLGIELVGLRAPIEIIPNGVYLEEFEPRPEGGRFYAAHPELMGKPFIFFLSRLHYKKGLDFLSAAFAAIAAKHPTVHLVIAGPDGGTLASFQNDIATAGVQDRVHVLGSIYGRERFHMMRDAACFCLPSRQEGFSIAILEAMACGTPAVVSSNCHFPEVAEHGAGEVVPLETPAIAAALDRVLSDSGLRERMGAAGRALVFREFTWPKIAQQTVLAYQQAIDRRKSHLQK